ncbi:orotidine 5'-phosphate decarboxylase [Pseudocyphellaria aurata]|nr:orotidine 5'-phosphate decarboxylase [Pseudocyphellaria aurata]
MSSTQPTILSLPYSIRADLPFTPPLTSYLLHLISIKRSNLCVSADVHTSSALLRLAEEVGDYICVLKTHADIVDDFSERTIRGLNEIARRKMFLIFEDRKFGDIGSTVQSQYTRGPLSIATWAHLTNAHLFPGPSIISALHSAATATLTSLNQSVFTEITTGTPCASLDGSSSDDEAAAGGEDHSDHSDAEANVPRKSSMVTATTTISQTVENTPPIPWTRSLSAGDTNSTDREQALQELGPPPHARGLLLIAEMSSDGNLITPEYTSSCVSAARAHPDFVMGFIAQHALNSGARDVFLTLTPGVNLPPESDPEGARKGDGLGQRWRSPRDVVVADGADIIIVGRGVLSAKNRAAEAERYRKHSWEAYEERIGRRNHD